jgi:hypothetical protein
VEADWEFEIGDGAPVIETWWPGLVDLRRSPASVVDLSEAAELPTLGDLLIRLNAANSPVWTSKCGVWTNADDEQFDADEFDAPPGGTAHIHGCYIDLLPRGEEQWQSADAIAAVCKSWSAGFRSLPLRSCRADLIIRRAFTPPERMHLAVTAYLTGSGSTSGEAREALEAALPAFADVLCAESTLQ